MMGIIPKVIKLRQNDDKNQKGTIILEIGWWFFYNNLFSKKDFII